MEPIDVDGSAISETNQNSSLRPRRPGVAEASCTFDLPEKAEAPLIQQWNHVPAASMWLVSGGKGYIYLRNVESFTVSENGRSGKLPVD